MKNLNQDALKGQTNHRRAFPYGLIGGRRSWRPPKQ